MSEAPRFDELAHAGHEHLNPDFVAGYDRKQGSPDLTHDLDVLTAHGLGPTSVIVDMGAGTGRFALAAARRFGRVIAVDISPVMIAHLTERASADGLANIETVQAGFLSYRPADASVDAVYTRNALHHLPDFWKALALDRMASLIRPGGVLLLRDLIYDASPSEIPAVLDRWLASAADDPHLGYTGADLLEHIEAEFSTFRWLLEPMLKQAGFKVSTAVYRRRIFGAYTCIRT
jgi:ubiquinone/menaquinone biosynthesis C-methylase UbiE